MPAVKTKAGVTLRFAVSSDRTRLQRFINDNWRKDHIFCKSTTLLNWQHRNPVDGTYQFVIAESAVAGEIYGLLGFIPTSQFDQALQSRRDYWLAIWKVREDVRLPDVGLNLFLYFKNQKRPATIGACGINGPAIALYKALGFTTGYLRQYFMLNPQKRKFDLVRNISDVPLPDAGASVARQPVTYDNFAALGDKLKLLDWTSYMPIKSPDYILSRYLKHPIYDYKADIISINEQISGLVVWRRACSGSTVAIRIVDVIGRQRNCDFLSDAAFRILEENDAEYIDCLCHGLEIPLHKKRGFHLLDDYPKTIVPNYFEPFESSNVRLAWAHWPRQGLKVPYVFVKGDSDQDRPNMLS